MNWTSCFCVDSRRAPPILCLSGPTAAGKSAAVAALAQRWPIEVINVDSATIYRGMDIGTAKPSDAERRDIAHHLLDIRDPAQVYSAAQFRDNALALIAQIRARGHVPVLCGGTMLYYKALRDGLDALPRADAQVRAQLDAQAAQLGWPAMHAQLASIDPTTAARLAPQDSQRIGRALEVYRVSGQPMSALLGRRAATASDMPQTLQTITISLEPSDRSALHARIARRYHHMLEQGLLQEVRALHARADLHPGLPAMRCVGYRQLWAYLDGAVGYDDAVAQAIAATRQLAKRQLTWLRAQPQRYLVDCLQDDAIARVVDLAATLVMRAVPGRPQPNGDVVDML